jgi:hypothetical protein
VLTVKLGPRALIDGDRVTVERTGLDDFAGCTANIDLRGIDDVASQWVANGGATVDSNGVARQSWEMNLGQETILEVATVRLDTKTGERRWDYPGALPTARGRPSRADGTPSRDGGRGARPGG